uniref:Uncharacterized protein n=1 Tax=Oryza rufipogon TaxID=4529 RepID=A0A0E0QXX1_ORYRU
MDPRYLQELGALLPRARGVTLPQVFVGGCHLGGAEEVRRLHESGELRRVVAGAGATALAACSRCGGERYVLCGSCNGSHKRYSLKEATTSTIGREDIRVSEDCNIIGKEILIGCNGGHITITSDNDVAGTI